jgi:hypothetical protein
VGVEAEFKRLAEECVKLAQQVEAPETKLLMIDMAQAWLKLAENTEKIQAIESDNSVRPQSR